MGSVGTELFWIVIAGVVPDFEPRESAAFGWLSCPETGDDVPICVPGLPSVRRVRSRRASAGAPARRPELTETGTGTRPQRPAAAATRRARAAWDSSFRSLRRFVPSRRATCASLSPRPGPWPVRHMMIRWACGARDDTQAPRTRTSRRRYRFQAFAEAFFLGGFKNPLPETALRSARDSRALIADGVALGADPDDPEAKADPEVDPKAAAAAVPAAPAAVDVPAWLARLRTEPTTEGIEEFPCVAPPVGDEDVAVPRPETTDDGARVAETGTLGADTVRLAADGTVAEGKVTDRTVATGVVTFGVVTVGVVTFGVVTVSVVTFGVVTVGVVTVGVVTVGVVTVGVVTVGVVTVGVVTFGVLATDVERLGVDTDGTATLGTLTWGVLTEGALTAGTATAGALTTGALTAAAATAGALTTGALTAAAATAGALTTGALSAGTFTDEVAGCDWSADATAAKISAKPIIVAARKARRRVCLARLDPGTTRIVSPDSPLTRGLPIAH